MATTVEHDLDAKVELKRFQHRIYARMSKGMTRQEAEAADRGTRHGSLGKTSTRSTHDEEIDRRVALWGQRERIVAYLPRLYEQREEALRRLADLDQLIADEEAAADQIDRQVA